jgi:non-canonical poly(A) RNA polymerase PAPD5/7
VDYRDLGRLSIIDPNNPENDISGGSSNYYVVKDSFAKAYDMLQSAMMRSSREPSTTPHDPKNTLLGPLFAGRYSIFEIQRTWLEKLAHKDFPERPIPDPSLQSSRNKGVW